MINKGRKDNGITLVALVVTVIVLIILAAVTISLLIGANGIIKRTQDAKRDWTKEEESEQVGLLELEQDMENKIGGIGGEETSSIPDGLVVPEDFTYIEGTIEEGAVVQAPDESEFVWIPVPYPVLDVKGKADSEINTALAEIVEQGKYPMAIEISEGVYKGVLYTFSGTTTLVLTARIYTTDGTKNREPDIISDFDGTSSDTAAGKITTEILQEEYNKMAKSVLANGGFYCR